MATDPRGLAYALAALPARLIVRIFFRRLEVAGLERLPPGPAVVAANHPNSILDPLVLAAALRTRRIRFLAAAFFFDLPLVRRLFWLLGVVPVFRREDDPDKTGENRSAFDAVVEALHAGGTVGIFPEGNTFADPRLQTVRTGAARMVLEALDRGPPGFAPHLVPVGLNYRRRYAFRSDVLVMVGEPLDPRPFLEIWREDPVAAGRGLTDALRHGLEDVTRNLDRLEDEYLVRRLEHVFRSEVAPVGPGMRERFLQSRRILEAMQLFRREDPEGTARVEALLEEYAYGLEALGLAESHLRVDDDGDYDRSAVLRFLFRVVPPLVLGAPVAAYGVVHNALPYFLVDPLARRRSHAEPQREAVRKIGFGVLFFGAWYAALTLGFGLRWGAGLAGLYLLSLPVTGFLALWWLDKLRRVLRHSRTFTVFVTRRGFRHRMQALREELVEALTAYSQEFRRRRGENPDPRAEPLPEEPED